MSGSEHCSIERSQGFSEQWRSRVADATADFLTGDRVGLEGPGPFLAAISFRSADGGDVEIDLESEHLEVLLAGRVTVDWRLERRRSAKLLMSGAITLVPAAARQIFHFRGSTRSLNFMLRPGALRMMEAEVEEWRGPRSLPPALGLESDRIARLARGFQEEIAEPGMGSRLLVESFSTAIGVELARLLSRLDPLARQADCSASPRIRRAMDYLEAHLGESVGLDDLAGAAGLSRGHLIRDFRRATGLPPHQYMLMRRVERGKALLLTDKTTTIADIAYQLGFSSQSHFTTIFRQIVGLTPHAFRTAA